MVRGKRKEQESATRPGPCPGAKIGTVLLDLHDAIRNAQQCRQTLHALGISRKEWLEIVEDVDPDMRFLARPRLLDVIVALMEKAGKPLGRETLVRTLLVQGGSSRQVRYSIQGYLRSGSLTLFRGDNIGLPEWSAASR
ncbi:MAG: hypothetical protein ACRD72_19525 [Candidatus Angelobacter sp.]|jgi:hypothetical protein